MFVNTNDPADNAVAVFAAQGNGSLNYLASYPTGGQGGAEQGAAVDKLASEGSVVFDPAGNLVLAVNAGSDSLSVFSLFGDTLSLRQVLPTGGDFPSSVAASGGLVYVLNAGGTGSLSGFDVWGGELHPVAGSTLSLGLSNTNPPDFLMAPGEVMFSPDGSELFVTLKHSGNDILAYHIDADGRLWAAPVVDPTATPAPFSMVFAGPTSSYRLSPATAWFPPTWLTRTASWRSRHPSPTTKPHCAGSPSRGGTSMLPTPAAPT